MRKKSLLFSFLIIFLCQGALYAQQVVTGRVSGSNNEALLGVTVQVSGSGVATTTDEQGNYSINAPANGSLTFNYVGSTGQTVLINGRTVININLDFIEKPMDEVVVTGYTSQRRRDIIGSVAVVDVKAMKTAPSGSAMQALQGQAAGVDVNNNGSPGAQSRINIRGLTSFNAAPLVLIDGMQGQINDVPAEDVESIQVLKDAGSASKYGARGSNGVIIITTKKGRSGAPQIVYDSYYQLQIPKKNNPANLLNAQDYARLWNETNPAQNIFPNGQVPDYYYKTPGGTRGWAMEGDPLVDPAKYVFDPNDERNNYLIAKLVKTGMTDMYSEIFKNTLAMNHNVSVSGGSDKSTYMLSLGYIDQQGSLNNTYLKRYSIRLNSEHKIRKNIRVGENVYLHFKDNPKIDANNPFTPIGGALGWMPMLPVYDIAGNYSGPGGAPENTNNAFGDGGNPVADLENMRNNRNREWLIQGNVYGEVDLFKDLTFRTNFGGNMNNYFTNTFQFNQYYKKDGGNNTNRLTENSGYYSLMQWTNTLNYRKQFGMHRVNALVGTESVENWSRSQTGQGTNFYSTDYNYLVLGQAGSRLDPPTSGSGHDALLSMFAELNYSFNDKYLIAGTFRRDGYSNFGRDSRYGTFGSVSVGWRVSEENFMKGLTWLTDLKLRASYGTLGSKDGVGLVNGFTTYAQGLGQSYYDINGSGNSLVQGFYPARNGNRNTSWENDKMLNVGFDVTLLNKFDISAEYYQKNVDGLLRPRPTPATAGEAASPVINLGDIQNKGFDIAATYRERIGNDFSFSVGVNFTAYKNKIVSLPDLGGFIPEGQIRHVVGHPMSTFFGYQVLGVFVDQKEVDDWAVQQDKAPGRFKFQDTDGNDTINQKDRTFTGDPNPTFTMGLNLSAQYKNFDLVALFYTTQGNDIYNSTLGEIGDWARRGNKSRRLLDAWTPDNTVTNVQKNELIKTFSTTQEFTSAFVEDGSFIRLRSLQLGYNVPGAALGKIGLTKLRIYLQATNLFTITKYSGLDPEIPGSTSFRGVDSGVYPQMRSVMFGFSLGL